MAARGARAGGGDAGDRVPRSDLARDIPAPTARISQRLKETGYVEGETVSIVYRFAENQRERLPALAAELVRR